MAALLAVTVAVSASGVLADGHMMAARTKAVVDDHLGDFGKGDVDAIVANYAPDAVIMFPGGMKKGHAEIRAMFEGLVQEFGQDGVTFEMLNNEAHGEVGLIVWKAETPKAVYELGADTFIVRDGVIVHQTVAAKTTTK